MSLGAWRTGDTCGAEEWQRHLARVDRAFGHVVERQVRDVELLLANGSPWETYDDAGTLVGVAVAIPDEECLVRVASDHPARATLIESGPRRVQEYLRGGVPLWVPRGDAAAEYAAESRGMALSYRDLQMRIDTATARHTGPPEAMRLRNFDASPTALRDVHHLVCQTWGVEDHWPEFLDRFGTSARERYHGRFGVVRHLDVAPSARRSGLGAWALNELVARFAEVGQPQAQLGVHDDNPSAAPVLYSALGWRVVSSQSKCIQAAV